MSYDIGTSHFSTYLDVKTYYIVNHSESKNKRFKAVKFLYEGVLPKKHFERFYGIF